MSRTVPSSLGAEAQAMQELIRAQFGLQGSRGHAGETSRVRHRLQELVRSSVSYG